MINGPGKHSVKRRTPQVTMAVTRPAHRQSARRTLAAGGAAGSETER